MRFFGIFLVFCGLVFGLEFSELEIKTDNISGKFDEKMIIKGFEKPILSNGNFQIKNKELFWNTKEPIKSNIKINSEGVFELAPKKKWVKIRDSMFDKEMFLAIFRLDLDKLKDDFDINLKGSKDDWQINLKPKSTIFKQIFDAIRIKGGKFVSEIYIKQANGDVVVSKFSDVK